MNTILNFTHLINLEKTLDPIIENKIKKFEDKNRRKLAKTEIEPNIFKEGLYELGVTHNKFNHAYLSLNISGKELISIGGIHKFIYLQNVNLSNNYLTSLENLSHLKHLTKLNASHNRISEIFDFDPPQNLEYADYSYNEIKVIENVSKNKYLKELILHHNQVTKIQNLDENSYLEKLDLCFNNIEFIENLDGLPLQKLNLMNNRIKNITGLENLNNLVDLNLSRNFIAKLKGLQRLNNLRYLYLSSNCISRAKQVAYVSELPYLNEIDFCYNDVQNRKFYRYQILFYLPRLRRLDGEEVTHIEKVKSEILFDSDVEQKKEIFKDYLNEEIFIDRRLFVAQQIDPESDSDENDEMEILQNRNGKKKTYNNSTNNFTLSSIQEKKTKNDNYSDTLLMGLNSNTNNYPFTY